MYVDLLLSRETHMGVFVWITKPSYENVRSCYDRRWLCL